MSLNILKTSKLRAINKIALNIKTDNLKLKFRSDKMLNDNTPLFSLNTLKRFDRNNDINPDAQRLRATSKRDCKVIELFAGGGGLAIGLEKAGLKCALLNEIDRDSGDTLLVGEGNLSFAKQHRMQKL